MSNLVFRHALARLPSPSACLVGHVRVRGMCDTPRDVAAGAVHERDLTASISPAAWEVLYALRARGHESYVVGGTVRDFLLGSETKDVDVCTSATPEQVQNLFRSSRVVGRRFPIIHVRQNKEVIEVSSFRTNCEDPSMIPLDWCQQQALRAKNAGGRRGGKRGGKFRESGFDTLRDDVVGNWSAARMQNASKRDFSMNGMLYEPFSRVLFDYVGGMGDCERRVLRTIQPPGDSFREDPARILRAIRLAARLKLEIAEETKMEMIKQKECVADLNHGRLQMELGAMLAYGSAEATYKALVDFDLLRLLLPHHHARHATVPLHVLRLMDDSVHDLKRPLAAVTYNGALFTMLVLAELAGMGGADGMNKLSAIDVVDEVLERVTAPKQSPKQLLGRKAVEQTSYLLREHLLLGEGGGSSMSTSGRRERRGRKGGHRTATSVLEDLISRAFNMEFSTK
jgi:poly(A) polymerase